MNKAKREIQKICQSEGVELKCMTYTGRGHIRLSFPEGSIIASSTPSDCRAHIKLRADIRKLRR
jgi:hypothetical protein